jgi:hypothetical protein
MEEMMTGKNGYIGVYSIFILTIILACILPGQAAQPTLATDPNSLSTFIAGTSQVLAAQTEQAAALIIPSITPTALPTETVIPTPQISLEQTSLVTQSDQRIVFTDYKVGIQMTLPAIWMPLRIGEKEFYKALESDFVKNSPMLMEDLTYLQTADGTKQRLYAFDTRADHLFNNRYSSFGVIYQAGDFQTPEDWLKNRESLPKREGHEVLSTTFRDTPNGIHAVIIERRVDDEDGSTYVQEIFFNTPSGAVLIGFLTDFGFKDSVIADFEQVVDGIALLK